MSQWTTTYSGLVSLLESFVEDTSDEFVSALPGIINRAEERCLRDLDLSIFDDTLSTSTTNGVATISKPAAIHVVRSVYNETSSAFLMRRSYDFLVTYGGSGAPIYYYEYDDGIRFAPTPDSSYTLQIRHMARPSALSASNTTNWLSLYAADLLLNAALVESERFLLAPERAVEFEQTYAGHLRSLRAIHREGMAQDYEPLGVTPQAERTR
jgi:hypothetical protein